MPIGVLDVDDVKRSWMSLPGHDGSHSTSVSTSSHHAQVAGVELDGVLDFTRSDIHLDRIVNLSKIRLKIKNLRLIILIFQNYESVRRWFVVVIIIK